MRGKFSLTDAYSFRFCALLRKIRTQPPFCFVCTQPDEVNKGSPIILLHFMVQQINCTRKKEDGSIVEGSEDDIRANSYVAAFQREYDEVKGELNWKIVDFRFNGAIAYL